MKQDIDRQSFLKLPILERRRILEQQAEAALPCYQKDQEWQEWVNFDIAQTDASQSHYNSANDSPPTR